MRVTATRLLCLSISAILAYTVSPVLVDSVIAASSPSPAIELSVRSGRPGTQITVTGHGFPAQEVVALYADGPGQDLGSPGPIADASGSFAVNVTWPGSKSGPDAQIDPTTPGPHSLCADTAYPGSLQTRVAKACADFVVEPVPTPSGAVAANLRAASSGPSLLLVVAVIAAAIVVGTIVLARRGA